MGVRKHDREDFEETKRIIRAAYPEAVAFVLETTDQDTVGFNLRDVVLPEGKELSETDEKALDDLADEVWHLVSSLGWNGVVGEDWQGWATVALTEA